MFDEAVGNATDRVKLADLFEGKPSLLVYSYMFGPKGFAIS